MVDAGLPCANYLIGDFLKAPGRPTSVRNLASERAQVIRNVAEFPDHRRLTEVAGRGIARPAQGDRADLAGFARPFGGRMQLSLPVFGGDGRASKSALFHPRER
jgi:hypothetical protein